MFSAAFRLSSFIKCRTSFNVQQRFKRLNRQPLKASFTHANQENSDQYDSVGSSKKSVEYRKQRFDRSREAGFVPKEMSVAAPKLPGIPPYEKLGENNNEFIQVVMKAKCRKLREHHSTMLLEGKRLISDAVAAGCKLRTIYFSLEKNLQGIDFLDKLVESGVKLKKVFYKDLKLFSDHVTSPGVVGVFERPNENHFRDLPAPALPLQLIADNIRDPGNLGTLIRSAAAVGASQVLCTKGCVDIWESKVVRSSCGAIFRIPVVPNLTWMDVRNYLGSSSSVFLADSSDDYTSEANLDNDTILDDSQQLEVLRKATPSFNHWQVNYFDNRQVKSSALVVGNEIRGTSLESWELCSEYKGTRVKILLEYGVDSLNSSVAGSVIMFEMKRQYESISEQTTISHQI